MYLVVDYFGYTFDIRIPEESSLVVQDMINELRQFSSKQPSILSLETKEAQLYLENGSCVSPGIKVSDLSLDDWDTVYIK